MYLPYYIPIQYTYVYTYNTFICTALIQKRHGYNIDVKKNNNAIRAHTWVRDVYLFNIRSTTREECVSTAVIAVIGIKHIKVCHTALICILYIMHTCSVYPLLYTKLSTIPIIIGIQQLACGVSWLLKFAKRMKTKSADILNIRWDRTYSGRYIFAVLGARVPFEHFPA